MGRGDDSALTRRAILEAAFERIQRDGFRAAGLDAILAETGLTKGALYHHFPSKRDLGYAVVDEILAERVARRWIEPLAAAEDTLEALTGLVHAHLSERIVDVVERGCPLANLTHEMAGIDDGFRHRLEALYGRWRDGLARHLGAGQRAGRVRADIDPEETAAFIVGAISGAFSQAKAARSAGVFRDCVSALAGYLMSLAP